jgi:farnesyl-diphosphate farnesyltransferase
MSGKAKRIEEGGPAVSSEERPADRDGAVHDKFLQDQLVKTSRTFALAIPLLPQPTARQVTVAYLLFRIADTFEDASVLWQRPQQIAALDQFVELLQEPSVDRAENLATSWLADPPTDHEGYLELLGNTPRVFEAYLGFSPAAREIIERHTIRTAQGMASVVERTGDDGVLRLADIQDLRDYCYIVAGIVGELLTDLFILDSTALERVAEYLSERAALFGEGLQLVNILKDSSSDATEGRNYLPVAAERSEVFALARQDLQAAAEYTLAVQKADGPDGVVLFTGLPLELAWATLERVERDGPGAKLSRPEVFRINSRLKAAVKAGRPAVALR